MCFPAGSVDSGRLMHRGRRPRPCVKNGRSWQPSGVRTCCCARSGIFYTCGGVPREGIPMSYRAIQEHDRRFPIRLMCRALAV